MTDNSSLMTLQNKSKMRISKTLFLQKLLCEYKTNKNIVVTGHEVNNSLTLLIDILSKDVPFSEYYKKVQTIINNENDIKKFSNTIIEYALGKTWMKYHLFDTSLDNDCYNKITNDKMLANNTDVIVFIVECPYCSYHNQKNGDVNKSEYVYNIFKDTTISKNLILNYIMLGIPIVITVEHYNSKMSIKSTSFYYNQFFDTNLSLSTSSSLISLKTNKNSEQTIANGYNFCEWVSCMDGIKKLYDEQFINFIGLTNIQNNTYFCYDSDIKNTNIPQSKKNVQIVHISTQTGYNIDNFVNILQKRAISKNL